MKTIFISFCMLFSLAAFSQTVVTPQKVTDSFSKKYMGIEDVSWEKTGSNFTATFSDNDSFDKEALFSKEGEWLETVTYLSEKDLLDAIKKNIADKYQDYEFEGAEILEKKDGTFVYKVSLFDGEETSIVKYNKQGAKI